MNDGLGGGTNVALKGRIPARVKGMCKKGDLLTISEESGILVVGDNTKMPLRLIALENKDYISEGLIEVSLI